MMKPWFGWGFCWGWAVGQLNRMILKPLYTMEMWKIAELWYLWARWDVWQMGWMVAGTWKVGSIIQQSNLYCKVFVERIRHNSANLWAQQKGFQNFGYIFDFWSNSSELPKNEKTEGKTVRTYEFFLVFQIPLVLEVKLTTNKIHECHALGISRSPWGFPRYYLKHKTQHSASVVISCDVSKGISNSIFHKLQIMNLQKFHTHHRAFRLLGEHQPAMVPNQPPLSGDDKAPHRWPLCWFVRCPSAQPGLHAAMMKRYAGACRFENTPGDRPVVFQSMACSKSEEQNNSRFWDIWELRSKGQGFDCTSENWGFPYSNPTNIIITYNNYRNSCY